VIPLLVEWVLLATTVSPMILSNRNWVKSRPRVGMSLWFAIFLSAGIAQLSAIILSFVFAFLTCIKLNSQIFGNQNWIFYLGVSFLPWIYLAAGGIAIALFHEKMMPKISNARDIRQNLSLALVKHTTFEGVEVSKIRSDLRFAFVSSEGHSDQIIISDSTLKLLTKGQLEALFWHEIGHIRGRHNRLKQIASLAMAAAPFIRTSQIFLSEISLLCEIEANNFAISKTNLETLIEAHRLVDF